MQRRLALFATGSMPASRALSVDLAEEELRRSAGSGGAVRQMGSGDDQRARADKIAGVAEDLCPVRGVVGDFAPVLLVLWRKRGQRLVERSAEHHWSCLGQVGIP